VRALLEHFGSPEAIFGRRSAELAPYCPPATALALARGPDLEGARDELERARRLGLSLLLQGIPGFPLLLMELPDPPVLLYLRGRLPDGPTLSVVGSRRPSARGPEITGQLIAPFARLGGIIVSGLAYGIDAAAHRGALDAGGSTLAVLASGLERPTPRGNAPLARRIVERGGGLLSEFAPVVPALAHHFLDRNRLISGLSRATLVVEARERSGSLTTARHALGQGRDLLVVPGPIDTDQCRGSNRLLRDGAHPVLEPADLCGGLASAAGEAPVEAGAGTEQLPAGARRLLGRLASGPSDVDALARGLGMLPGALAPLLLELELAGRIARDGDRISRRL
jgi:DNA processing protein